VPPKVVLADQGPRETKKVKKHCYAIEEKKWHKSLAGKKFSSRVIFFCSYVFVHSLQVRTHTVKLNQIISQIKLVL